MPKTYSSVWLHIVWGTKLRKPNLFRSFRYDLFNYLKSYGEKNDILVDVINGIEDHVHLLIRGCLTVYPRRPEGLRWQIVLTDKDILYKDILSL
jgi:hypothetical protein